jgi:DNA replication regulator SLD3
VWMLSRRCKLYICRSKIQSNDQHSFAARLPERCAVINRKLGGPVTVSQPKPRLSKSASFSSVPLRPGAATKRPLPVKPREQRTLQRVLSDDRERRSMSQGPNKKIALMRSATMPSGVILKRETSEAPSLSSIPVADSQAFASNRGGMLNSKRFAKREVDMSSMLPDLNPRAKQKAVIAAELKDAISALTKPNRELAGKTLAEIAEKRSASAPRVRKSKKPVRNPLFQSVQIIATPKAVRRKDMHSESQHLSSAKTAHSIESSFVPASSLPSISQSTTCATHLLPPNENQMFASIQATPTRRSTSSRTGAESSYGGFLPSSPLHVRRSSAQLFASVPESAHKVPSGISTLYGIQETPVKQRTERILDAEPISIAFTPQGVQETPVKKRVENVLGHSHPIMPNYGSDKENEKTILASVIRKEEVPLREESIYKSLGWDDDNDIDDLA